jgi:hypothetical protein
MHHFTTAYITQFTIINLTRATIQVRVEDAIGSRPKKGRKLKAVAELRVRWGGWRDATAEAPPRRWSMDYHRQWWRRSELGMEIVRVRGATL